MNVPAGNFKKEGAVKHIPIYFLFFRRSKSIFVPVWVKEVCKEVGSQAFEHPPGKHLTQQSQVVVSTALHEMAERESLSASQSRLQRLGKGARERPRHSLRFYEFRVWQLVEMVDCWLGSIIQK
jgi:hypothetical protein